MLNQRLAAWRTICFAPMPMTCRIDRRVTTQGIVVLSLSGRITAQSLDVLRDMVEREGGVVALDLKGVLLVDGFVVRFLAVRGASGIELRNCPPYIREWIVRESAQLKPDPSPSGDR